MCLAAFSHRESAHYRLVFAANRDELHARATAPAGWWEDADEIFGGRDLIASGSWLAVDRSGRLAAVTNYREDTKADYSRSRGDLVRGFLRSSIPAADYVAALEPTQSEYGPFNLILFDGRELHYASNRTQGRQLSQGTHALSNARLGAVWPKVIHAEARFSTCVDRDTPTECLLEMLADSSYHGDPTTAADRATELRSTIFINDERYGTRCSTVVLISQDGVVEFTERRFAANGLALGETAERFRIGE